MSKQRFFWRNEYFVGLLFLAMIVVVGLWAVFRGGTASPPAMVAVEDAVFIDAGSLKVAVSLSPEAPQAGSNRLLIQVRSPDGAPIEGAEVKAAAEMPAMGAMPAMLAQADIEESSPGHYWGSFALPMAGQWALHLEIRVGHDLPVKLGFNMATGREGLVLITATPAEGTPDNRSQDAPKFDSILIENVRRQAIGVKTGRVEKLPFAITRRLQGKVTYDPASLTDISLRFDGWIGELMADFEGKAVERGDILFTVYSPELLSLQEEFLQTVERARRGDRLLLPAARKRLRLWGLNDEQIDWLENKDKAQNYVPIFAPRRGVVIERNAINGSAFRAGDSLLRLADLSNLWIEAYAYERDLPLIKRGMAAILRLPYLPETELEANVMQVDPFVGPTRTARVRLQVDNSGGDLRPGAFVNVYLTAEMGERLVIPEDAVLISGEKRIVFLDLGGGRLQPREITTGHSENGKIVVLKGLSAGDHIVTSGNFLVAAESKLKLGINQW